MNNLEKNRVITMINYIFYQAACTFPAGPSSANMSAWRERMKGRLLGKTQSALMLLVFGQTQFSALAQCPPPPPTTSNGHPALLAGYAKRPPWKVAGVDYPVGVPATLTDWRLLSGPGITVNTTNMPPYVRVDDTSNVVISGVDFSLHGGAEVFFVNSPNLTVTSSNFGGTNLTTVSAFVIYADSNSPGLTVSYNTIDGAGAGSGSALVGAAGAGTATLSWNWLKHFPQRVLAMTPQAPYSVVYTYNLIEQGAMEPGAHLNYLEFGTNGTSSSVDVEYNTSYQTRQVAAGEGYQFYSFGTGQVRNVTYAYNVMIAAAPGTRLPVPTPFFVCSGPRWRLTGVAHDDYIDRTAAYSWFYGASYTGWNFSNNYNMTTGALTYPP
jgi:hypothetical protein